MHKILVLLLMPCAALASDAGKLVIVGGGLTSDNEAVYREFIEAVGFSARIGIVTAASAAPVESANSIRRTLERYGVVKQRMVVVHLAVEDDPSTPLVDEGEWSENAADPEEVAKLSRVGGIWFAGGDQSRLVQTLLADGQPTPMLRMIRSRHKSGAVLGGTSAGAAIMSDPMITQGESLATLLDAPDFGDRLGMSPGLGFFRGGIIDQHFDARARLGRLAVAIEAQPADARIGFGIDENTALVVDEQVLRVVGEGQVTIVDGREGTWENADAAYVVRGLKLSILSPGDRFYLDRWVLNPASYLRPTRGNEYFQEQPNSGGGIALPVGPLSVMLGENLVDNAGTDRYTAISFALRDELEGLGVRYTFTEEQGTRAYSGRDKDRRQRYTIMDVGFGIEPLSLKLDAQSTDTASGD